MLTGTVVDTEYTSGSPFGEQWWTFEINGEKKKYAMCLNWNVPERWPKPGETVDLEEIGDRKCHTGANSYIVCGPWANLVKIHREIPCGS